MVQENCCHKKHCSYLLMDTLKNKYFLFKKNKNNQTMKFLNVKKYVLFKT